ncbi:MAG TPA: sensor histidine kinase [Dehalococcoidales bacterium]|nr:sensor histidine kinase [Dehalococcoidales bacterium]
MSAITELYSYFRDKIIRSPHFWIIFVITVTITLIYYRWQDWFPWFWHWIIVEFAHDFIGSLYTIPILYTAIVFWWRGPIIVWTLSEAAILPCILYYRVEAYGGLRNIAMSLIPLAIIVGVASQLEWRRRQREMLAEREKERQTYISETLKAQEGERQRIALELHDGATQDLLAIANRAQGMVSSEHSEKLKRREQAEWIRDAILRVVAEVRGLSIDLRPSIIDNVGLIPAIRWLAECLEEGSGIKTRVLVNGEVRKLHADAEASVFRIVQETLNNIRRHSRAKEALVRLSFAPESLCIVVEDNGVGFSPPKRLSDLSALGRLGLAGIDQRAKLLNGTCVTQSQPGKGTSVSVELLC